MRRHTDPQFSNLAIGVDADGTIVGTLAPVDHILRRYPPTGDNLNWGIGKAAMAEYWRDKKIKVFTLDAGQTKWWA